MREIIFLVEEAVEGGYNARAIGQSIVTHADTLPELDINIREAVQVHFYHAENYSIKVVSR